MDGNNILCVSCTGSNDKKVIIWNLSGTVDISEELKGSSNEYTLTTEEMWPQYEKMCKSRMLQEKEGVSLKASFDVPKVDFNSCLIIGSSIVVAAARYSDFVISVCGIEHVAVIFNI